MTNFDERWRLSGKRALVTGGTKGIGYAVAAELLQLGAHVTIAARTAADVDARVSEWRADGFDAAGIAADLSTPRGARAAVAAMGDTLDILISNVGTNVRKTTLDYSEEEYRHVLGTNLDGAFHLCRAAHPLLAVRPSSSVVLVGSVAGTVAVMSGLPYALSKAALDQMARYLAAEWGKDGIRVNAVNPWYTRTPLAAPRLDATPGFREKVLAVTPLGRIAEPEDVSGAVAFLCLPAARHISGVTLAVDGGFLGLGFS